MNKNDKDATYPTTDLVILAGGQARRMNGINKLLHQFDDEIQLLKIYQQLKSRVNQVWINSHRDHTIYQRLIPSIQYFQDDEAGFHGPLMGMKSAWSHVSADYVLFVPCDVTYIPNKVISRLHRAMQKNAACEVAVVEINNKALFPFCLLRRSSLSKISEHLRLNQRSLKLCFQEMHMQMARFKNRALFFHSINSFEELQQHRQLSYL
ncbi:NTP transferase domain-containing protein [Acinetobacter shaoyimingii]|uniref:Molybdenum cofactor guanylyltransferase n=1 Tax=Acinetobacter shaoyimingii TaxID=2715164 RepID=A0A6G8RUQ6_9GAMM|nr:NTP transferase domain-containing protein [Acinetobacter shaoyimingii]QIO05654.1 NTP transferase domain-containing protein [Acinetobacter shaoyimingii]